MGWDAEQHKCAYRYDCTFSTCSVFLSSGNKCNQNLYYVRPEWVCMSIQMHISLFISTISMMKNSNQIFLDCSSMDPNMADQMPHLLHASTFVRGSADHCCEHAVKYDSNDNVHVCHHPRLALSSLHTAITYCYQQMTRKQSLCNKCQKGNIWQCNNPQKWTANSSILHTKFTFNIT